MGNLFDDRERTRALFTEMLDEIRQSRLQQTEQFARWQGAVFIKNDVLQVATRQFNTSGHIKLDFAVPAGSIEVSNSTQVDVTVAAGGPESSAPAMGLGVYIVPAGAVRQVNVASRQITLYGKAGDLLSFQVMASGGLSRGGQNAVDGGAA